MECSNLLGCQAGILARSLPFGGNQGTAPREDGYLFLPVKLQEPIFSQGAGKNFPSSWVPTSFGIAGLSNPNQRGWERGWWAHGTLEFPMQGAQVPSLVRELDPACHN